MLEFGRTVRVCSVCGNWEPIASNISALSSKYSWAVPTDQTLGSMYKILIRTVATDCFDNCPPADMSDYYFNIIEESKPDLIISDISWTPENPETNESVNFQFTITLTDDYPLRSLFLRQ